MDLATNVTDKLDFLDINRSGLTKLQVLLVSLEVSGIYLSKQNLIKLIVNRIPELIARLFLKFPNQVCSQ